MGSGPATWFTAPMGLFSATPHLCLRESSWSEEHHVALERYHVVDAATAEVAQYTSTTQAYSDSEYASLLVVAGFDGLERCRSLGGPGATPDDDLFVVVGHSPGATG